MGVYRPTDRAHDNYEYLLLVAGATTQTSPPLAGGRIENSVTLVTLGITQEGGELGVTLGKRGEVREGAFPAVTGSEFPNFADT